MKIKEIYYKIKKNCELPVALLTYTYKDFNDVLHPFNSITVDFSEDEKNINIMKNIHKKYGNFFMFFNNSDEGIEFWKNNPIKIIQK